MRPIPPLLTLLYSCLLIFPARSAEIRHFEDAALHAVQLVDKNEGWAVGDEGVVWHTIDGGQHWERQPTGVRASLRSLHFLNPYNGWIAGREELAGGGSAGVLLYTADGGVSWQRVLLNALPGLNVVRFLDDKVGIVAGDGADHLPTGVFLTQDSGKTWQPVAGPRCPSWLAGTFSDGTAVLAGVWNRLARAKPERVSMIDVDVLGGRNLRGLHFLGKRGVAVGQGGLVLVSDASAGVSWNYADLGLQPAVRAGWDFHAVHGVEKQLWVVGRPGSAVLHSKDQGDHWEILQTRQPLPLNGVFFIDARQGWAVGEMGSILATGDGGRSWKVQQRGGQRAAVLFVHARPQGLPLDTVALLGGQEGYLSTAIRVAAPDSTSTSPKRASDGARFGMALRQAGGTSGEMLWQFPIGSHVAQAERDDLLRGWDQLHGGQAAEQLLRQMVLALRMWRPDVIIADSPEVAGPEDTAGALVAEALRAAFDRAADKNAFPEQTGYLGLETWQSSKLYAVSRSQTGAQVTLDLTAVSAALESSPQEFAQEPALLLAAAPIPAVRSFRLLAGKPGAEQHKDLMQGVSLAPGGLARRQLAGPNKPSDELLKAVHQRATLKALSEAPLSGLNEPDRLLSRLGPMLADMPDDQAVCAAYAVASQFARAGQWQLAREAFLLITERYPTHPLTVEAYRWLVYHGASSEARRRHEMGQFLMVTQEEYGQPDPEAKKVLKFPTPEKDAAKSESKQAPPRETELPVMRTRQTQSVFAGKVAARLWYQSSLDLEPRLAAFGPLFSSDPALQFCLQSARRNLGDFQTSRQWYGEFAARQPDGPWRSLALGELWLTQRTGTCPRPLAMCRSTEVKPFLDGKFDDACWQAGPPLRLNNAAGETAADYPTELRLAYDKDFLYIALRCFHPSGCQQPLKKPRSRDGDQRSYDRVSLLLDLDRDYATCFHLQIDQRGCLLEDCWGDKSWDPRWFVAVQSEARVWTVEAAIPMTALTGDVVTPGRAWAFNAIRVLPGRGVQAWSLPAEAPEETLRPEGLGLLLFTSDTRQTAEAAPLQMPRTR